VNDELEKDVKGSGSLNFNTLSRIYLEELRKVRKSLSHDCRSPGQNLDPGLPVYETLCSCIIVTTYLEQKNWKKLPLRYASSFISYVTVIKHCIHLREEQ
jgi:hypothetical protein